MKLKQLLLVITLVLFLSPIQLVATTIDSSINLTQRPSLKFDEAISAAEKALGVEAKDFSCTIARSKTRSSGGGWNLQFRSLTLPFRWIHIDKGGKVISNEARPGLAANLKAAPKVSIERAIDIALGTRENARMWFPIQVDWDENKDEWFVMLVNSHRVVVNLIVDAKEKAKVQ